ncbi:MAG: phenylalanine 4-monooxygenase [Legionellaceae bacterium]|nr:phenylalanine 4-monooxygenase [Legionellaceae bacterium]
MTFISKHVAKQPNHIGIIEYSTEENQVWRILFERQMKFLPGRACDEHLQGLEDLAISADNIPQLTDINCRLKKLTQWEVVPVKSMVPAREFFSLLALKQFPVATFIRSGEEIDYATEPDIFHELFGHCPIIANTKCSDFMHYFACKSINMDDHDLFLMQQIFIFTFEFGLINTSSGLRAYGAGLLSSPRELVRSLDDLLTKKVIFDLKVVLKNQYHIDKVQDIYFIINNYDQLLGYIDTWCREGSSARL